MKLPYLRWKMRIETAVHVWSQVQQKKTDVIANLKKVREQLHVICAFLKRSTLFVKSTTYLLKSSARFVKSTTCIVKSPERLVKSISCTGQSKPQTPEQNSVTGFQLPVTGNW